MPPLHVGRDAADLRNLLLRQPVIVRASTGERVRDLSFLGGNFEKPERHATVIFIAFVASLLAIGGLLPKRLPASTGQ